MKLTHVCLKIYIGSLFLNNDELAREIELYKNDVRLIREHIKQVEIDLYYLRVRLGENVRQLEEYEKQYEERVEGL